jgi:hypothetical protein
MESTHDKSYKKFGETFLTKERFKTQNEKLAKWLPFQFRVVVTPSRKVWYKLSWLGIINSAISLFGLYIKTNKTKRGNLVKGYDIKFK